MLGLTKELRQRLHKSLFINSWIFWRLVLSIGASYESQNSGHFLVSPQNLGILFSVLVVSLIRFHFVGYPVRLLLPYWFFQSRVWHRNFPVNFANFSSNTFFTENLWTTASRFSSKYLFYRISSLPVKKSSYCKVFSREPATLMETKHFHKHILICLALM